MSVGWKPPYRHQRHQCIPSNVSALICIQKESCFSLYSHFSTLSQEPKVPRVSGTLKCPGKVYNQPCHGTMTRFDTNVSSGWAIMHHKGEHSHLWPEAKKPNPLSKELFTAAVKNNPSAGALKLKESLLIDSCFNSYVQMLTVMFSCAAWPSLRSPKPGINQASHCYSPISYQCRLRSLLLLTSPRRAGLWW
jgi:hypothetical protein